MLCFNDFEHKECELHNPSTVVLTVVCLAQSNSLLLCTHSYITTPPLITGSSDVKMKECLLILSMLVYSWV